jgi:hypothetical protein
VAAYGFEESGGSKVIDASGNGNHGTLSGTVRRSTKRFGTAMEFNGSSSMITVNDSVSLDLTKGMTLQAWVYPTAKTLQTWHTVIAKEKSGGAPYGLYVTHDSTRAATIIEVAGTQKTLMPTGSLPIGKWTHLAATYDGVTQRMFVNGTQVDSRPQAGFIDVSDGKLRIGGNLTWAEYFKGRLDEVRIYNRALSQAEILADSQSPVVTLMLSTAADRSNPVPLAGDVVSGTIYVFYQPLGPALNANPVNQVEFWLDDPQPTNPTGAPRIVERQAPFDFAGTTSTGTAMPFNTSALAKGVHTISARVTLKDGTVLPTATGRFTIP